MSFEKKWRRQIAVFSLLVTLNAVLMAGTLAHYAPGVYNIRDYYIPDPGYYTLLYAPYYHTGQFKDSNGYSITTVTPVPLRAAVGL